MIQYNILSLDYDSKTITFFFDNDINKSTNVNVFDGFKQYVVATNLDYYIDMNTNELVRIPGGFQQGSKRVPTLGYINYRNEYYRPAFQSEVDYDDLIKYDGDNGKMYNYLENFYNKNY